VKPGGARKKRKKNSNSNKKIAEPELQKGGNGRNGWGVRSQPVYSLGGREEKLERAPLKKERGRGGLGDKQFLAPGLAPEVGREKKWQKVTDRKKPRG